MYPNIDSQFEDKIVEKVSGNTKNGWSITTDDGFSFFVDKNSQITPEIGMKARFYGKGIGRPVRGLFLDGIEVFYKKGEQPEHIYLHAGHLLSWTKEGWLRLHNLDGESDINSDYNLFLIPEEETLHFVISKTKHSNKDSYFISEATETKDELNVFTDKSYTFHSITRPKH